MNEDTLKKLGFIAAYEFLFGTDQYSVAESVTDESGEYSEWQEEQDENEKMIKKYKQFFIYCFNNCSL